MDDSTSDISGASVATTHPGELEHVHQNGFRFDVGKGDIGIGWDGFDATVGLVNIFRSRKASVVDFFLNGMFEYLTIYRQNAVGGDFCSKGCC